MNTTCMLRMMIWFHIFREAGLDDSSIQTESQLTDEFKRLNPITTPSKIKAFDAIVDQSETAKVLFKWCLILCPAKCIVLRKLLVYCIYWIFFQKKHPIWAQNNTGCLWQPIKFPLIGKNTDPNSHRDHLTTTFWSLASRLRRDQKLLLAEIMLIGK